MPFSKLEFIIMHLFLTHFFCSESELLHVYYGNRSATYYQMQEYQKALEDADEVIRVAPHWPKVTFRFYYNIVFLIICFFFISFYFTLLIPFIGLPP